MKRLLIAAAGLLALTGCGHVHADLVVDKATVETAAIPVVTACVDKAFPQRPLFDDSPAALKAAKDFADRDRLVKGSWPDHQAWEAKLEAQIDNCR